MRTRSLLAFVVTAALAACGPHTVPAAGPSPAGDSTALVALPDTSANADSIARVVLRGCRWGSYNARRVCVERSLDQVLDRSGIAKAMAVLDTIAARNDDLRREAHGMAHGLGIAAYKSPETVAQIFAACPNTQISGCYHGVIQGYFLDVARRTGTVTAEDLARVCTPHRSNTELYMQCVHGMGHGVMAVTSHRLPDALKLCDLLRGYTEQAGCWSGAFMENIVGATHPEHTAEAHAAVSGGRVHGDSAHAAMDHAAMDHGAMGHEGMDHGAMVMDHGAMQHGDTRAPWKALDPKDPLYPCDAVDGKYGPACYLIQTAAILGQNGGDVSETAHACSTAPAELVRTCYASLGRDLTAYAGRDPRRTAELCARAGDAELDCLAGAAIALYEVDMKPDDAFGLCRAVDGTARKTACYEASARRIHMTFPQPERMGAVCGAAEAGYVAACRAAASLPPEPAASGAK
ncbi:MAG: hypothetical protein JO306_10505 [Gemmatimonadetes bacterium]|nr:hypothetical protein [Gemmatimonadota bacterium]